MRSGSNLSEANIGIVIVASFESNMSDRAARYAAAKAERKTGPAILVGYVVRTPKGKIRLKRIGIRLRGQKEHVVTVLPPTDPRYVFENDYKVRKATHDETKRSAQFSRFYDSSVRVVYAESEQKRAFSL